MLSVTKRACPLRKTSPNVRPREEDSSDMMC
jgi:hypothetical protein